MHKPKLTCPHCGSENVTVRSVVSGNGDSFLGRLAGALGPDPLRRGRPLEITCKHCGKKSILHIR